MAKKKSCRLLALPAKLRLTIYEATGMCGPISLYMGVDLPLPSHQLRLIRDKNFEPETTEARNSLACMPSLAAVNRQLHAEITKHFFSATHFNLCFVDYAQYGVMGHTNSLIDTENVVDDLLSLQRVRGFWKLPNGIAVPDATFARLRSVAVLLPALRIRCSLPDCPHQIQRLSVKFMLHINGEGVLQRVEARALEMAGTTYGVGPAVTELEDISADALKTLEGVLAMHVMREAAGRGMIERAIRVIGNLCFGGLEFSGWLLNSTGDLEAYLPPAMPSKRHSRFLSQELPSLRRHCALQ